jgi:hypothetical protein
LKVIPAEVVANAAVIHLGKEKMGGLSFYETLAGFDRIRGDLQRKPDKPKVSVITLSLGMWLPNPAVNRPGPLKSLKDTIFEI